MKCPTFDVGKWLLYLSLVRADTNITTHPTGERHFMTNIADSGSSASHRIGITDDNLTSRAGLAPFVRYLSSIGIYPHLERLFGGLRRNRKGWSIPEIFKQLFCFFADGTSRHLVYFDGLKQDEGYAGGIESSIQEMLSSHSVKRFFSKFYHYHYFLFRRLLQKLFIWRLRIEKPSVIILDLDTMVMDNNDADVQRQLEIPAGGKSILSLIIFEHGNRNTSQQTGLSSMFDRESCENYALFRLNRAESLNLGVSNTQTVNMNMRALNG